MEQDILVKIIHSFLKEEINQVKPMENGANNLSYKVEVGKKNYILRIYQNHGDISKFLYENEILQTLKKRDLSFMVPAPILTVDNEPYVLIDEKIAILSPFIEGSEASRESIDYVELGEKVAELSEALQTCQPMNQPSFEPTYQLFKVHPSVTLNTIHTFFHDHEDQFFQEELSVILEDIEFFKSRLPIQIIHGDLMLSNVLLNQGEIAGILDFEFVSPDFRMTEVAITMSQLIRENMDENRLFTILADFIKGYCQWIDLSDEEIHALPTLIKIRMVTLVFHFLGRYIDGLDPVEIHKNQLNRFHYVCEWVNQRNEKLVGMFMEQKKENRV